MVAEAAAAVGEREEQAATALSRGQMLDRIRSMNPTANAEFLGAFNDEALEMYLERLRGLMDAPRGRGGVWVRRGATPAMVYREAGD